MQKSKNIVYTCITNGKNDLLEWKKEDGFQYICFTDGSIKMESNLWEFQDLKYIDKDPRRTARYHKTHPFNILPHHEKSIWIDGSLFPRVRLTGLIQWFGNSDYAVRRHPGWNCIYEEASAILRLGFDENTIIDNVICRYVEERFPIQFGLHETGLLIRSNTMDVNLFDELWWEEIENGSKRDQMSFDYIRWKLQKEIKGIPRQWVGQVQHKHKD